VTDPRDLPPPTQSELDLWEQEYLGDNPGTGRFPTVLKRLIAEVERGWEREKGLRELCRGAADYMLRKLYRSEFSDRLRAAAEGK
jgi:hypothetical protein